jgi:ribose 1,5-bisphosphate isomerase
MKNLLETAEKIRTMEIRGAGRIATAAAFALREYAETLEADSMEQFTAMITDAANVLIDTRPTAVSLPNAVRLTTKIYCPHS